MKQLAYISKANAGITKADIDSILSTAIPFNKEHNITGTLLYNGGLFLQLLEGDELSINFLLEKRIKKSKKHNNISILFQIETNERLFPDWNMSFLELDIFDINLVNTVLRWNSENINTAKIKPQDILELLEKFKYKAKNKA